MCSLINTLNQNLNYTSNIKINISLSKCSKYYEIFYNAFKTFDTRNIKIFLIGQLIFNVCKTHRFVLHLPCRSEFVLIVISDKFGSREVYV